MSNATLATLERPFYIVVHVHRFGETCYPIVTGGQPLDLDAAIKAINQFEPGNLELDRDDEEIKFKGPFKTLYFIPKEKV